MVTIELCMGFILAIAMTGLLVGASLLGVAQATAAEASAQLARQAARGDDVALAEAMDRLPDAAVVELERQANGVHAEVKLPVRFAELGFTEVTASAWAVYEPGIGP